MLRTTIIQSDLVGGRFAKACEWRTVNGGVNCPVLWLKAMNEILRILHRAGVNMVAYAYNLVILVLGMFPFVMNKVMESTLRKVWLRAVRYGHGVSSTKMGLMLLTTKTRVPGIPTQQLNGQSSAFASNEKYLSMIPDLKLNWKLNIELMVKEASIYW